VEPFFSVVIAAFNRGDMLRSALASIRYQTFADFEVWAVDDGSTDNVPEVLASFASDKRFQMLTLKPNRGMNAARNAALEKIRGRHVTFLDSDDLWLPNRLERFAARLNAPNPPGFLFSNAYLLRFGRLVGTLFDPARAIPEGKLPGHYAVGDRHLPYVTSNVSIAREAFARLGGFKAGFKATDTELFARYLAAGVEVGAIRDPIAVRRLHEDQITAGHAEIFRQSVAAYEATGASAETLARLREETAREVALHLVKAARPAEARAFLLETLGEKARSAPEWGLSGRPAWLLRGLRDARAAYLRLRYRPAFLPAGYRAAWDVVAPLLAAER
jgi:glycosyltransferase involved in cell wall biosynthesis